MKTDRWFRFFVPLVILVLLLAACGSSDTSSTSDSSAASDEATTEQAGGDEATTEQAGSGEQAASGGEKLEIFSWWTDGGEADGLNAMFDIYKQEYPNIEVVNAAVAGGAGSNARTVLKTRLQGGQPPDSWQVHAGKEALTYIDAGQLEPLTDFFAEQGLNDVMPDLLLEQITFDGEIWTVPVNIHRSNVMWYNKQVFADNGLEPPTTLDEFFTVAETLQAAGVTPLALGGKDKFETPHLFESVLLATYGPEAYSSLFENPDAWSGDEMTQAIDNLKRMVEYSNDDRAALGWADAAQRVIDGKAAMTIMGDWAHGYFLSKGAEPDVDYGWAPSPGTDGTFIWLSDSFGLAKGAPDPEAARDWLMVASSREGQDAFNPKKGSIPARTDADKSLYDDYLTYSIEAFNSNTLAPSIVHGAAAPEGFMTDYGNALNVFGSDLDNDTLLQSLEDASRELQ